MASAFNVFSQKYSARIESFISEFYRKKAADAKSAILEDIYGDISEFCLRPGKRIRPLLLLAAYSGYCPESAENQTDEIIKLSAVLEIMHSFLLVHDDVIDKAEKRRGSDAMHVIHGKRYGIMTKNQTVGNDVAVITGDMMAFDCIGIIADADVDPAIKSLFLKIFADTYIFTTWGQLLDIVSSMPHVLNRDSSLPYDISKYKTAFYTISNPLIMGYVLGQGTDEAEMQALRDFSIPAGLCFQFRDDLLGVFGADENTGKSSDSDIAEGKYTLLIDYALNLMNDDEKTVFSQRFVNSEKTADDINFIREMIVKSGAREAALEKIRELSREAFDKLEKLKISDNIRLMLEELVSGFSEVRNI